MTTPLDVIVACVARTAEDLTNWNTLRIGFETREIVVVQGKQFRNDDTASPAFCIPDTYTVPPEQRDPTGDVYRCQANKPALPLVDNGDGTHTLVNADQGVIFTLHVLNDKQDLETWLDEPEAHLIYAGHARYGRGPCFGKGGDQSEEWEEGDGSHTGIFRMGFPFIGIPVSELLEHGYTADLLRADTKPPAEECHPELRPHLGGMKGRTLDQIGPGVAAHVRDADPTALYWSYKAYSHGGFGMHVVHRAGWILTRSVPHEIGAFDPHCRVYTSIACSTFVHHYPIVRKRKGWKQEGNERYAYWTTAVAPSAAMAWCWVYHILSYDRWNAFMSWKPSLEYAVKQTNRDMLREGWSVRMI